MVSKGRRKKETSKVNWHVQSIELRVPRVCVSMDLSMSIVDDNHELDRILESTNLDKYELMDLAYGAKG